MNGLLRPLAIAMTLLIVSAYIIYGCGLAPEHYQADLFEAWDRVNAPERLSDDFVHELSALPSEGKLDQQPWSDTYWPSHKGGLADRWNDPSESDGFKYKLYSLEELKALDAEQLAQLSPAEKYDILVGNYNYPLVNYERQRTSPEDESWFGLCHGWAPAALNFVEPNPVDMVNADGLVIPFGSADVKALLTFAQQFQRSRYSSLSLGGRCNDDIYEDPDAGDQPQCRDVNAGSFHIVLSNYLGIHQQGFVADVTRDRQVWNQPIFGYSSKIVREDLPMYESAAADAVKIVEVETFMDYVVEVGPSWHPSSEDESGWQSRREAYRYTLELDKDGMIVGGEWLVDHRPDFLWVQSAPVFSGYFTALGELYADAQ